MKIINHYPLATVLLLFSLVSAAQTKTGFSPTRIPLDSSVVITVKGKNTHFLDDSININFHYIPQAGFATTHKGVSVSDLTVLNDTLLTLRVKLARNIVPTVLRCYITNRYERVVSDSTLSISSPFVVPNINPQNIRDQYSSLLLGCQNFNLDNDTVLSLTFLKNQVPLTNITIDSLKKYSPVTSICWIFIPHTIKPDTYELNLVTAKQGTVPGVFIIRNPQVYMVSPSPVLIRHDSVTVNITGEGLLFTKGVAAPYIKKEQNSDSIKAYAFEVVNNNNIRASFYIPGSADTGKYNLVVYDSGNGYVSRSNMVEVKGALLSWIDISTVYRDSFYQTVTLKGTYTHFRRGVNTALAYKDKQPNAGLQVAVRRVIDDTTLQLSVMVDRFAPSGLYTLRVMNEADTAGGNFTIRVQGATSMTAWGMLKGNQHNRISLTGSGKKTSYHIIAFKENPTINIFAVAAKDTFRSDSFDVVNDTLVYAYFNMPFKLPAKGGLLIFEDSINGKMGASISYSEPNLVSISPMEFIAGDTLTFTLEGEGNVFDSTIWIGFKHTFDSTQNEYMMIDSVSKITPNLVKVHVHTNIRVANGFFPVLHLSDTSKQYFRPVTALQPRIYVSPLEQKFARVPAKTITFMMRYARHVQPVSVRFTNTAYQGIHSIQADSFYTDHAGTDTLLRVVASISDTMRSVQHFFMELTWNNGTIARTELQLIAPQLQFIEPRNIKADSQYVFCYTGPVFDISDLKVDFYNHLSALSNGFFEQDSITMANDTLRIYTSIAQSVTAGDYFIRLSKPYDGTFKTSERFYINRYNGMFDYASMQVTSYPNPVSVNGVLSVVLKQLPVSITLIAANGQEYIVHHAEQTGTAVNINLQPLNLSSGLYFMRIELQDGTWMSGKVMVGE